MDLKALIAEQRARIESTVTDTVDVVMAGQLVTVEVSKLLPDDWQVLVLSNPPRSNVASDARIGYDQDRLPRAYPAEKVKVAGESVDQDTWADTFAVLDNVHRNNVATLIWGVNVFQAVKELQELGKAPAVRSSSSPGNRESRRAASRAANQQK